MFFTWQCSDKISYMLLYYFRTIYCVPLKFVEKTVYCLKHAIDSKHMYCKVCLSMCFLFLQCSWSAKRCHRWWHKKAVQETCCPDPSWQGIASKLILTPVSLMHTCRQPPNQNSCEHLAIRFCQLWAPLTVLWECCSCFQKYGCQCVASPFTVVACYSSCILVSCGFAPAEV